MLLQLRLLGEDDVTSPGAAVDVHDSSSRCAGESKFGSAAAPPSCGDPIVGAVVWRRVGWTLDRVFITSPPRPWRRWAISRRGIPHLSDLVQQRWSIGGPA